MKDRFSGIGNVYLVEKVLRIKSNKVFVQWLGFNKEYVSWIDKTQLVALAIYFMQTRL